MAATTQRATTPTTEPFPPLEADPRTPVSLPGGSAATVSHPTGENPYLLRPTSAQKETPNTTETPQRLDKPDKPGFSPATSPLSLTGLAAMAELKRRKQQKAAAEEARQTSPNPAVEAMHTLMGNGGISKASDAPAPDKLSEPLRKAAEKIQIPENIQSDSLQASPVSMASFGTLESTNATSALTATTNDAAPGSQFVAEPAQMTDGDSYNVHNRHLVVAGDDGNKAFSYPGPPPQPQEQNHEGGPSRGMSYPGPGQSSPKSPASNKRHKCPYCSTDFTRHHNLKSHLLTHSQEKPYVCQTCQARFRRLHDLKRHTKLHTGERPHTCDKCGRRFARGDALARHNKGPGGCAGRRSSFGGDGEYDDGADPDGMDGVEYGDDDERESDQHARRVSEPSRKRAHLETPQDPHREVYRQHSSTYPPPGPLAGRPHGSSVSSMAPPTVIHPGSSTATSPREMSNHPSPAGGSSLSSYYNAPGQVFNQQGLMTESPKPLSPGQPADQHRLSVTDASHPNLLRNRSPSLTTQFQQQHFGRGSGGRTPPQPPAAAQFATSHQAPQHAPVLPPIGNQPQARTSTTSMMGGPGPSMLHHQQLPPTSTQGGGQGSNQGSLSSHGRSSGSSMRDVVGHEQGDIWNYVRSLEQRFHRMQDEYELRISRLQQEVIELRGQMSASASYSSEMQRQY